MNTNARTSGLAFYKNTGHEKRNHNNGHASRFYTNSEADRKIIAPSMSGNSAGQDAVVASVMKLFKGTLVSMDAGAVHWHCREIFP